MSFSEVKYRERKRWNGVKSTGGLCVVSRDMNASGPIRIVPERRTYKVREPAPITIRRFSWEEAQ